MSEHLTSRLRTRLGEVRDRAARAKQPPSFAAMVQSQMDVEFLAAAMETVVEAAQPTGHPSPDEQWENGYRVAQRNILAAMAERLNDEAKAMEPGNRKVRAMTVGGHTKVETPGYATSRAAGIQGDPEHLCVQCSGKLEPSEYQPWPCPAVEAMGVGL